MQVLKEAFFGALIAFIIVGGFFLVFNAINEPRKTKEELLSEVKKRIKK